jgi:hypothetical protein
MVVSSVQMVHKAAESARWQRRHGDARPLRELFVSAYSLLRYLHGRARSLA